MEIADKLREHADALRCGTVDNFDPMMDDLIAGAICENERLCQENDQLRAALDNAADIASKALRKAWQLGQTYWQQADSEYVSQHKKSDETHVKFQVLVDETRTAIIGEVTPNAK